MADWIDHNDNYINNINDIYLIRNKFFSVLAGNKSYIKFN